MEIEPNKFNLIILPFVLRSILFIGGYAAVRLILDVGLDAATGVTQELWHIWMPVLLAAVFSCLVMRRRFRLLKPDTDTLQTERRREAIYWIAIIAVAGSMLGSQKFITSQFRELTHVNSLSAIGHPHPNDAFKISSYYITDLNNAGFYSESRNIPKRHGPDDLELIIYAAIPMLDTRSDSFGTPPAPRKWWLVKQYKAEVRQRTDDAIEREHRSLWSKMDQDLTSGRFRGFDHLSVAPRTGHTRSMLQAVDDSPLRASDDAVILIPEYSPFEKTFTWLWVALGIYLAGLIVVVVLIVFSPAIGRSQLDDHYAHRSTPLSERLNFGRSALAAPKGAGLATWSLIGMNCAMFIVLLFAGVDPISPSPGELLEFGGATEESALAAGGHWRVFTSMFLHGGVFHLGYNMFALFVVGMLVEVTVKPLRYVVIYLVSGVVAFLTACLFTDPKVVLVGASGAIFGIMGLMMSIWVRNRKKHKDYPWIFFAFGGASLLMGMFPGISNSAHIGGLTTGFALGLLLYTPPQKRRRQVPVKPATRT